jgi:hypothetical protein
VTPEGRGRFLARYVERLPARTRRGRRVSSLGALSREDLAWVLDYVQEIDPDVVELALAARAGCVHLPPDLLP